MMKTIIKFIFILSFSPLFLLGNNTVEIESLSIRIDKYGKLAKLHLQRAQLYINNKDFKSASIDLSKAVSIDPSLEEAQYFLAEICREENKNKQAKLILNILIQNSKNKKLKLDAKFLLADIYLNEENSHEALYLFQEVFDAAIVQTEEHYIKVAQAFYEIGDFKESIRVLKKGLKKDMPKEKIREKFVDLSISEGHYSLALSMLDKMIKQNSNNAKLYYKRAQVLKEQGNTSQMKLDIKKARLVLLKHPSQENQSLRIKLSSLYATL